MDTVPTRTLLCTNRAFSLPAFFGVRGQTNQCCFTEDFFFVLHFPKDLMLLLGSLGWVSAQKLPRPFWHCCSFRVHGLSSLRVLSGEDKGWPNTSQILPTCERSGEELCSPGAFTRLFSSTFSFVIIKALLRAFCKYSFCLSFRSSHQKPEKFFQPKNS